MCSASRTGWKDGEFLVFILTQVVGDWWFPWGLKCDLGLPRDWPLLKEWMQRQRRKEEGLAIPGMWGRGDIKVV